MSSRDTTDHTHSCQKDALQPRLPIFLRATEHVNVIRCVLEEAKTIGGLDGKDIRLRRLMYPRDHVCVKIGKRTEERFVLSLRKKVIQFLPRRYQKVVSHIVLFGEPKTLLSQFKPSFGPFPWFALPLNIGTKHRRTGWHDLSRKQKQVKLRHCHDERQTTSESYRRMQKGRQRCFLGDQKVDHFVLVPGIDDLRYSLKKADWSLYNELLHQQDKPLCRENGHQPMPKS